MLMRDIYCRKYGSFSTNDHDHNIKLVSPPTKVDKVSAFGGSVKGGQYLSVSGVGRGRRLGLIFDIEFHVVSSCRSNFVRLQT